MKGFNRARLRAFIQRRRINAMGLYMMTFMSAVITVICAIQGFKRTGILAVVTILMVGLCFLQEIKLRKNFRTIKSFKGFRRKKKPQDA